MKIVKESAEQIIRGIFITDVKRFLDKISDTNLAYLREYVKLTAKDRSEVTERTFPYIKDMAHVRDNYLKQLSDETGGKVFDRNRVASVFEELFKASNSVSETFMEKANVASDGSAHIYSPSISVGVGLERKPLYVDESREVVAYISEETVRAFLLSAVLRFKHYLKLIDPSRQGRIDWTQINNFSGK